jgi:hypothetical protein
VTCDKFFFFSSIFIQPSPSKVLSNMSSTNDAATLQALLAKKVEVCKKQEEECWEEQDLQRQLEEVKA